MMVPEKSPVFTVAEVAQAHEGSLGLAHSYIDAVAATGADAIKFQVHIAAAESSPFEQFRVSFSYEDKTRYEYWKRMEFTPEQWLGIKEHCDHVGLEFLASPFSIAAIQLLENLCVKRFKVASGEIGNLLMLEHLARSKKPLWLSSGMSSFDEIGAALAFLDSRGASKDKVLFQCTTAYPTAAEEVGLNVLGEMQNRFCYPVGLSDHSGTIFPALASIPLGARFIECHVVFDKKMFGPDASSSLTMSEFKTMVDGTRYLGKAMNSPVDKNDTLRFATLKQIFGRTLSLSRDVAEGETVTPDCLEAKKPRDQGIPVESYLEVLNRRAAHPLGAGQFLKWEDLR